MPVKDWTPEQWANAMRFGICLVCREPREAQMTKTTEGARPVVTHTIVCPNGHPQ